MILPCSQPAPLIVLRVNAFGCALGAQKLLLLLRHSTRSALNLQGQLSECINPAPKMHSGMCPSAVAFRTLDRKPLARRALDPEPHE